METFFIHLIKSSCILLLFLLTYHTLLKRETHFTSNRLFLIIGLVTAIFLPFISLTKTIYVEAPPISTLNLQEVQSLVSDTESINPFDWALFMLLIYILGIVYFSFKLILQLRTIQKIKKDSEVIKETPYFHVLTNDFISPFSFFKHIFYHQHQFSNEELKTIISHEKVHAKGLHSLDILFTEIIGILLWFNPVIWYYKIMVKQNLEFLADSKTCTDTEDKRSYQYLMLKQATGNQKLTIVNPFFNSIIKKRIVMLNQNQSRRINLLKLGVVIPFLVLFLVGFNTKEVVKFSETPVALSSEYAKTPNFMSPLKQGDILKISSSFGLARSPFSDKMENHTGIDLVAKAGKDVVASAKGTVTVSSTNNTNGNYVVLNHSDGYSTKYLHLKDRTVKKGDKLNVGDIIGHVGNTGKSTGTHLHFEILQNGKAINPSSMIPFKTASKAVSSKTEEVETTSAVKKRIEIKIDKDTSNEELEKIKKNLAEKGFDFSYTAVHNDDNEIISLSLDVKSNKSKDNQVSGSSTFYNEGNPINSVTLVMDDENTMFFMGESDVEMIHEDEDHSVWIHDSDENIKTVTINEENGKKTIRINGKKVTEEEYDSIQEEEESDNHHIKIKKSKKGKNKSVMILKSSDGEGEDMEWLGDDETSFFFLHGEGDKDPLYIVDGKESTSKKVKRLDPDTIERIDVSKGDAAIKKYGEKAKNGVVEIITKKN